MDRGLLLCKECRHQSSVTAGTIFQGTRKPLRSWFHAAWWITTQKYGANALGLQRVLGLRSYQTAWTWAHKLRRAMVRPGRDRLSGIIEVDEMYVGGQEADVWGRETQRKAIVAVAAQVNEGKLGRIRLRCIADVKGPTLISFVKDVIEPGSLVQTDGWRGYHSLPKHGFRHQATSLSASPDPAHVVMPHVHRVASLLKRWLLGTYQGSVSRAHLDYYLDEFTFRFNRRTSRARGMLFYRLISQAVQTDHTPTQSLYLGVGRGVRKGNPNFG